MINRVHSAFAQPDPGDEEEEPKHRPEEVQQRVVVHGILQLRVRK
jgi:hypothetical protein